MGNNPFTYKSRLAGLVRSSYMHGLLAFERIEQMTGAMQEISSSGYSTGNVTTGNYFVTNSEMNLNVF